MSIIQEALRKAQKTTTPLRIFTKASAPANEIFVKLDKKPEAKNNAMALFLILLAIVVLALAAVRFFSNVSGRFGHAKPAPAVAAAPAPKAAKIPEAPSAPPTQAALPQPPVVQPQPPAQQNRFVLSGIMHLEDGPRAIINNARVAEGDSVEGAAVMEITDDSVVLQDKDSKVTLQLK